jgi:hypothetical protein
MRYTRRTPADAETAIAAAVAATAALIPQKASADRVCRQECSGAVCQDDAFETEGRVAQREENREGQREGRENREGQREGLENREGQREGHENRGRGEERREPRREEREERRDRGGIELRIPGPP